MNPVDADAVVAATLSCTQVARMSDDVATYLPGRRVTGVRVTDDEVEVHIVARWDTSMPQAADAVRRAVGSRSGGRPVAVFVDDIELPASGRATTPELTRHVDP